MAMNVELIRDAGDESVHILAGLDAARCGRRIVGAGATWSGDVAEITCPACLGGDDDSDI